MVSKRSLGLVIYRFASLQGRSRDGAKVFFVRGTLDRDSVSPVDSHITHFAQIRSPWKRSPTGSTRCLLDAVFSKRPARIPTRSYNFLCHNLQRSVASRVHNAAVFPYLYVILHFPMSIPQVLARMSRSHSAVPLTPHVAMSITYVRSNLLSN